MTTRTDILRRLTFGVFASGLLAAVAAAQAPAGDARWEPWLGCWQSAPETLVPGQRTARVCVTPVGARSAIEVATVSNGNVVARDTIDASGERRTINTRGCTGWQSADWSADARRVYLHSELSCGPSLTRTSSGVIAMTAQREWLDIHSASANGNSVVRTVRYFAVTTWSGVLPAEFASVIAAREQTPYASNARALAGSPIAGNDVIDAATHVDANVVQEWLIERGQPLDLDARSLVALANAGVPGSVTDVLIGLAFPQRFALTHAEPTLAVVAPNAPRPSRYAPAVCDNMFDPLWYSPYEYGVCASRYGIRGFGYGSGYGYGYGYGYGSGYGYGYPGYPGYDGGYGGPVIVGTPGKNEPPHGVAVNGRGYTRPPPRAGTSSVDITDQGSSRVGRNASAGSGSGSSGGSASSGKASGSSSGSSSSGSSSSSGRTAQPKPPKPPPQ